MRILMLHPHDVRYHPWTIRMVKLAENLSGMGHEVQVAFVEHKRAIEPDFPRIREIPDGPVQYVPLRPRDKQTRKNIGTVMDLAREVDLIHFQKCFASVAVPALWASWRHQTPLHYDWDDNETQILEQISGLPFGFASQARFFERRLPHYVDTISVSSDALAETCREMGFPESRMGKVPVGADLEAFSAVGKEDAFRHRPPLAVGDRPIVAYIGQLEGAAYASLFIRACAKLVDRFPDTVWLVVGGGHMLVDLEELAFELRLSHKVVFTDYIPSDQIPQVLASTNIAVACFGDEEFVRCKSPLKIAEYMAAGKPIVASDVGEVGWMTGGAAVLVPPGNVESLAEGIAWLLKNPDKRKELGKRARARAESEINWRRSAEKLAAIHQSALEFSRS